MELWKTTLLPTDDAATAREILEDLVYEEPHVLLLVFGTSDDARTLAERGSRNAGAREEPWWVVWIRDPECVRETLEGFANPRELDWEGALGVVLNCEDEIHAVFTTLPRHLEILAAFTSAARV